MSPYTIAFFGISGSGKGTQVDLLEKYLKSKDPSIDVVRPEMGALLRAYMMTGTPLAGKIRAVVEKGGLTPSFVAEYLLTGLMNTSFDGSQHILLDGTCRKPDQSRAVDDLVRLWNRGNFHAIVLIVSKETAKKRLLIRARLDDVDEAIERRFAWYQESVVPSSEEMKRLGWPLHEVDGEGTPEAVHKNILSVLGLPQ